MYLHVFVFGDFNVPHKGWLAYSDGTDRPGELFYYISISNDLTSETSICSPMAFPLLGNSVHVVSVSIDLLPKLKQDTLFHCIASNYSLPDWDGI